MLSFSNLVFEDRDEFFHCFPNLRHFDCHGLTVLEGYLQLMSKYMAGFIYYILMSLAGSDTVWLGFAKSKVKIFCNLYEVLVYSRSLTLAA